VVLVFLAPADQRSAVAVQLGLESFDDPSSCARAAVAELDRDLLAPRADMRREPCSLATSCIEAAS
jgi:hypothetical protein